MKPLTVILLCYALAASAIAQCNQTSRSEARLQWSERAEVVSPDRVWEVEVIPVLTREENATPVILRRCGWSKALTLFSLQRDAEVFWAPDSKTILVINQPTADTGEVLLFDTEPTTNPSSSKSLNENVKMRILEELGTNKSVRFFLPEFVAWRKDSLVLTIGGATSAGETGPMQQYCYGVTIDSNTRQFRRLLSADVIATEYKRGCRIFP